MIYSFIAGDESSQQESTAHELSSTERRLHKLRDKCQHLLKGYIDNLTIHGATRIFTGSPAERVIWTVSLFGVFAYFFYSVHSLLSIFLSNEVIINNDILDLDEQGFMQPLTDYRLTVVKTQSLD